MLFEGTEDKGSIQLSVPDGARIVVVSDAQVPLEDKALLRTIFDDFVPWFKPKGNEYHLFLAGDVLDSFNLSTFLKRVVPRFTMGDEIEMTKEYLSVWGKRFTHKHFAFGNHEDRWEREIFAANPQLAFAIRPLHEMLALGSLQYTFVPYLRHYDVNGFVITHGDIVREHTAAGMLRNYMASGASGHTNRPQSFSWSDAAKGHAATWYNLGMTCRTDIGDVIKDWRRIQPWQQGFGIGEVRDGAVHFQLVRVHHGSFYAAGRVFDVHD